MSFSKEIKENALVAAARHCCVCHRCKGLKIEVHHIIPESIGGSNSFDNAIALCFDCHTDAGHYNDNHPRGTKFSPSELRKARDTWYQIARTHNIPPPAEWVNDLHLRYLICRNEDEAFKIIRGDLSVIPLDKPLLAENEVLNFFTWVEHIKTKSYNKWHVENNWFKDVFEYKTRYPDAREIDRSDPKNPYFHCERIPSREELLSDKFSINDFNKLLINSGIEPAVISRVYSYAQECGGGEGDKIYTESVTFRPIWFAFVVITNMALKPIRLQSLSGTYVSKRMALRNYHDSSGEEMYSFKFPEMSIESKQSVVIPIALILAPLENLNFEQTVLTSDRSDPGVVKQFSIVDDLDSVKGKFFTFGPIVKPVSVTYTDDGSLRKVEMHPFDLQRTYILSSQWNVGSCPHLFYGSQNKISYVKELFAKNPGDRNVECFIIPETVIKVIIAELEMEETFIERLQVNDELLYEGIVLQKDETLEVNVKPGDSLKIIGLYKSEFQRQAWELTQYRAGLIGKFMQNYYCQLHRHAPVGGYT